MFNPIEPSADIRQACSALRQVYVGLLAEGFDKDQALAILGHVIVAASGRRNGDQL